MLRGKLHHLFCSNNNLRFVWERVDKIKCIDIMHECQGFRQQKKTLQTLLCKVSFSIWVLPMGFARNHNLNIVYLFLITACAAARRAMGTRNGEQDT